MKRSAVLLLICSLFAAHVALAQEASATADENAKKARAVIEQMIAALGGERYMSVQSYEQEGRASSFYHGSPNGSTTPFWRFVKLPDKERVELLKTREWVVIH